METQDQDYETERYSSEPPDEAWSVDENETVPDTPKAMEDLPDSPEGRNVAADIEAAFAADVAPLGLLGRQEEERLGRAIARCRTRVVRLLRRHGDLVDEALSEHGRGVVRPEIDFRERETVEVLSHARRRLQAMRRGQRGIRRMRELVATLERDLGEYRAHRDRMLETNVRLVMSLARRYRHPTLSYLDLVQEGMLGLLRAIEKYAPERGIKFSTYAVWWIWQQIARAADCQGSTIRTPVHWNQLRRKVVRSGGRNSDEAAEQHGLSPERFVTMTQSFQCVSLAAPLGDEDDRSFGDTLPAANDTGPEEATLSSDLTRRLNVAVDELPHREAEILRQRFGLRGARVRTLEDIGDQFGVSRERIRQLEARAIRRMRAICDEQGLGELLN